MKVPMILTSHDRLGDTGTKTGFRLEEQLAATVGVYQRKDERQSLLVVDGLIITGQNPASPEAATAALVQTINQTQA